MRSRWTPTDQAAVLARIIARENPRREECTVLCKNFSALSQSGRFVFSSSRLESEIERRHGFDPDSAAQSSGRHL